MTRWEAALAAIGTEMDAAWTAHERAGGTADEVLADPSRHPWRLVDAAMDRSLCPECGARLGAGNRGCGPCDLADGIRFAARESDRAGVPAGNEHAIRVSTSVLRAPHRYPPFAVRGNRLYLPLLVAGQMATRAQQLSLKRALDQGRVDDDRLAVAGTFEDLVALAWLEARGQSSQ